MSSKKKQVNFIRLNRIYGLLFIIGVGVSILAIDLVVSYRDFNLRADDMRSKHISRQKALSKQEVSRVVKMVYYNKAQSEDLTKKKIKHRVYEAHAIAQNIYSRNKKNKTEKEIRKMILDALRPIRFERGTGYYFATRLNGVEILFADKPEMEGLNLLETKDTRGKYVIKDMITIARKTGEGFYEYHWTKPLVSGNHFKKISFIKRFEPYDWFIGTGLYVDDVEETIKSELLSVISRIRYGKEGYIFVNSLDGDALVSNGEVIKGTRKLWDVFDKNPERTKNIFKLEYDAAVKPDGDYIYYSIIKLTDQNKESPKTSFIYGIPEWNWLIGSGVYLDDVESEIAEMRADLINQEKTKLAILVLVVAAVLCFFLFLFNRLTIRLKNDFNLLLLFFKNAAFSDQTIDRGLVQFEELDLMAENANKMLNDRRQVESALRMNEERLRTLMANIPGVSYRCVFDDFWTMAFVSDSIEELSGYPASDFVKNTVRSYSSIVYEEDRQAVQENVRQSIAMKKPFIAEYRIIRNDGDVRWVFEKGQGVPGEDEQVMFIDGVLIDITDRKKAEEKMLEALYINEKIIDKSPVGIAIYDETGQCISTNRSLAKIIGTTKEIALRQNYKHLSSWQQTGLVELAETAVSENTIQRIAVEVESTFGRMIAIDCQLVPLITGNRRYLLLMVTDMTEIRKMQTTMIQSEKMLSVGGLAAGMAHEINNPLAGMMQTANVMEKRLTTQDIAENMKVATDVGCSMDAITAFMEQRGILRMLTAINHSGQRISDILKTILSYTEKKESPELYHNMAELLDKTLELAAIDYDLERQYNFKTIEIRKEYGADLPKVACDGAKVQQVLLSILRNGAQAMQAAGIAKPVFIVRIFFDAVEEFVVMELEDNGPGMDETTQKRIFEPFFSTRPAGPGLGLSVSYFIITEHHGGELAVESLPGEGTTFFIRLPVQGGNECPNN